MMPLYSMLASGLPAGLTEQLPKIVAVVGAVALLVAFIIGFSKGFRWVSWGGLVWLGAGTAFFLIEFFATKDNMLSAWVKGFGLGEGLTALLPSAIFAGGCILIALAVHGIMSLALRPSVKRVPVSGDRFTTDENGIEYDDEEIDYDDYEEYRSTTMVVRKGYGKPSLFGRFFGGVACLLNVAAILIAVATLAVLVILSMSWQETVLKDAFSVSYVQMAKEYICRYGVDFLMIGLVLKLAQRGFEKGFFEGLRSLLVKVGGLVAIVAGFWLPFSAFALAPEQGGVGFIYNFVNSCTGFVQSFGLPEAYAPLVGKIVCGLVLCIAAMLVIWLINTLLKKLTEASDEGGLLYNVNGVLASVVYTIIGAAICFIVFAVFYLLSANGVFDLGLLVSEGSLAKDLLMTCRDVLEPSLVALKQFIATLIPA